ncbi:hypothetical protein BCR43DRAFT_560084 [Syncephalastrum racemosum]|uniref:Uncharacterized protein n=1 Tax=Syncephalastrum racemosum TaxID=13706 RepID=A0A1X2HUU0_SYNRA|nr:hypothetical protein BCR43DRAFT_560084 [Syncephalastrum racemosum]
MHFSWSERSHCIFESLTWIIALYVLWRVAKRQGGWRGTISRMCLYGGYLCALIIVLCTLFNVMHTPKELAPLDGSIKASNIQKNHTAPAEESIANPASIEHISMDPIIDNVANEAEQASSESMSEQEPAMPKIDEDMETLSQPSAPESVHRSDADTAEPFRFADTIDIPAVISWILHIGAQWSMAGLVPLLTYMQREQIPSICSFAAYGVLVTLFPVATGICNILAALYVALGYALYSVHPMEGDKIDEETMEYLKERAETWSTLTMLALQYMLVIALYLAAWFGRKWEATHLRQHLHDDHDAYRFDSYPHDAKQPILGLNEKPDHIRQGSRDYATAVDVDLTRRSV